MRLRVNHLELVSELAKTPGWGKSRPSHQTMRRRFDVGRGEHRFGRSTGNAHSLSYKLSTITETDETSNGGLVYGSVFTMKFKR